MSTVLEAIDFMEKHLDKRNIIGAVKCVLIQLYMPPDLVGYQTVVIAICEFGSDKAQSMTKELYVAVGRQLGISRLKVEKDIRDAIKKAWNRRDEDVWWAYFPQEKMPTNKEFISRIAEVIDMWQACEEKEHAQQENVLWNSMCW